MMTEPLIDTLPEFYRGFLPDFFSEHGIKEKFATCSNCPMTCGSTPRHPQPFLTATKCCTYQPTLPNFLVGALLQSKARDHEGRRRVCDVIERRLGVTPLGIRPPKLYSLMYEHGKKRSFGQSEKLLCSYYLRESGQCAIWQYRNSTCSTWFCTATAGDAGSRFWAEVRSYLISVETALLSLVLVRLEVPNPDRLMGDWGRNGRDLGPADLEQKVDDAAYAEIWGKWAGKEQQFFEAGYELVRALTPETFNGVMGVAHELRLATVERQYRAMTELPSWLRVNNRRLSEPEHGDMAEADIVHARRRLLVPRALRAVFDGKTPTSEAVRQLADGYGIRLEPEVLIALYHGGVLVRVDPAG